MATATLCKAVPFRPETYIYKVTDVAPSANTTYDIDIPPGAYSLSLYVYSSVTGTSTIITAAPFCDSSATTIATAPFRFLECDDGAAAVNITLAAGAAGRSAIISHSASATGSVAAPIALPYGMQVSVTVGAAQAGETLEIRIIAVRAS